VTDVERFFRRLVNQLAATDPGRLRQPVPLDEIYRDILPYRTNRRALQLDTSEEYELVLLRLCAGEEGLVETAPAEARARFVQELRSANPDLDVLRSFEDVQVTIRPESLMEALDPVPRFRSPRPVHAAPEPYDEPADPPELILGAAQFDDLPGLADAELVEPDEPEPEHEPVQADATVEEDDQEETASESIASQCPFCGGSLPGHRAVNFCPQCGQSQTQTVCPRCRSDVEPGWRHCVNCGAAVAEG
jgi:hypothetical protein